MCGRHPWQDSYLLVTFSLLACLLLTTSPSVAAFGFSLYPKNAPHPTGRFFAAATTTTRWKSTASFYSAKKYHPRFINERNHHHVLRNQQNHVLLDDTSLKKQNVRDDRESSPSSFIPTGLEPWQEDELEQIFDDVLSRLAFVMEQEVFLKTSNPYVRDMFQTCVESVEIGTSTIPGAGRGLFATRDIPPGTIVAFYPIHAIGCKLDSGSCLSLQMAKRPEDMIQVEQSEYALYSLIERPLLGVDLMTRYGSYHPRLFVDMNPKAPCYDGWLCGFINDAAMVQYPGDTDYYRISRGPRRNVEIVPFGRVAPFQVGVTTRHVKQGEELFVSYGYNYWASKLDDNDQVRHHDPKQLQQRMDEIQRQEDLAAMELAAMIQTVQDRYALAAEGVAELFEGLDELPILAPVTTTTAATTSTATTSTSPQQAQHQASSRRGRRWKDIPQRLQQRSMRLVGPIQKLVELSKRLSPRLELVFRREL